MSYCFSDTCKVPDEFDRIIPDCNEFYSLSEEETKDFGVEWSNKEERNLTSNDKTTVEHSLSAWHYKKDDSFLYMGQISSYRGGGYIIELGPDEAKASEKLGSVKDNGWVDRYTRALFTELSLPAFCASAQVPIFSVCASRALDNAWAAYGCMALPRCAKMNWNSSAQTGTTNRRISFVDGRALRVNRGFGDKSHLKFSRWVKLTLT